MSTIDIESLLSEISPEAPCGENLEYDPDYLRLEKESKGTPAVYKPGEREPEKPAEEPNWHDIRDLCLELMSRTRDISVTLYLTIALLKTEGLPGVRDGLALLRGLLERFWEHVHPQMDPDDRDPVQRANLISSLSPPPEYGYQDTFKFKQALWEAPLCRSRRGVSVSFRDILIAKGEINAPDSGVATLEMPMIDEVFGDTPAEQLQETVGAVDGAIEHLDGVHAAFEGQVGVGNAPDLSDFKRELGRIRSALQEQLAKRGYGAAEEGAAAPAEAAEARAPGGEAPGGLSLSGELRNTEEVLLVLDKVCRYYEQNEPSSPVPLLVRRAQRLVSKDFLAIIRDLSPDAMRDIEAIGGITESPSE